jgi:hypothetical protein
LAVQSNNNKVLKRSEPSDYETFNGWNLPENIVSLKELLKVGIPFKLATLAFRETGNCTAFFLLAIFARRRFIF